MDEESKIVIKETIEAIAKPVQGFINKVAGEPGKKLGLWITDGIRGKRLETQVIIYEKAQILVEKSGISPNAVNLKILVPLLENGSLESDEDIVDMWAHLLANSSVSSHVRSSYLEILKELEPVAFYHRCGSFCLLFAAVGKKQEFGSLLKEHVLIEPLICSGKTRSKSRLNKINLTQENFYANIRVIVSMIPWFIGELLWSHKDNNK